jgi:hypothetical protein
MAQGTSTQITGTVAFIKVNKQAAQGLDSCFFGLNPTGGGIGPELFILWQSTLQLEGQQYPTAGDWVLRNATMWMLRDAFLNQLPVTVYTDDQDSALVDVVQLGALP